MPDVYSGKEIIQLFKEASTFGTGELDNAAATQLAADVNGIAFTPDVKVRVRNENNGQNWNDVSALSNDKKGSNPMVVIPTQCFKTELPDFLYAALQSVTEGVDPFQKEFIMVSPGPDFAADAGYFMTIWEKAPVAANSQKIDSALCEKLEFTLSPDAADGNLAMVATMKGVGYSRTSDPSGALTKSVQTTFNYYDTAVCTLDGADLVPSEIKITIENTMIPVGRNITTEGPQTYQLAPRVVKVEISALWDTGTIAALAKFDAGTEVVFILGWGTDGVDGYLNFNIHGVIEEGNYAEEDVRGVTLTINGASDLENTEDMINVKIADGVDRSW